MNAVTKTEEQSTAVVQDYGNSLMEVIAKAARDPNVDIDKMERLLQMQDRVRSRDAEQAFNQAFSQMQPQLPHITVKNKIVHNGRVISEYADWPSISAAITPTLSEFGFSLNFGGSNTSTEKTTIAKLRHVGGHMETNEITLPHDTSGAKNKVQAIGSSSTYGQRYAGCPLVGVVVHGADDDGEAAGGNAVSRATDDQVVRIESHCKALGGNVRKQLLDAKRKTRIPDLTEEEAVDAITKLADRVEAKAKQQSNAKAKVGA